MKLSRSAVLVGLFALAAAASVTACRRAIVIVPAPSDRYTERDTLYGRLDGNRVRISFRFDTLLRVDTITRLDTLWRGGTRTVVRVDTLRLARVDTVVRRDTIRIPSRDTIRLNVPRPGGRVDTVRVVLRDTVVRRDTVRVVVRDTVFRTDTVRLAGQRQLFVPPGQYPPAGQCRVWIHDRPPGQQARAAPCDAVGPIPAGAFILFGGEAWDFDYDWIAASRAGGVPPEIVALKRRGGR
jgi:hypothetical protein